MNWFVVTPSNRPDRLAAFKNAWLPIFARHEATLLVVEDAPEPSNPLHFSWRDLPSWFPRRTDMIRSFGFWQAWAQGANYVLSLDDDVLPASDVFVEYAREFEVGRPFSPYLSVGSLTSTGLEMRGFPYKNRAASVVVQYGGWNGVPDLDGATQIEHPKARSGFAHVVQAVPRGTAVTGCAMNMAFKADLAPIMWQLPLLDGRFNRFGDIWSGLIQKRVLDSQGMVMLVNGRATVRHERASDPSVNMVKEAPGLPFNEDLWEALHEPNQNLGLLDAYRQVTDDLAVFMDMRGEHAYADHFTLCRDRWLSLFQ